MSGLVAVIASFEKLVLKLLNTRRTCNANNSLLSHERQSVENSTI